MSATIFETATSIVETWLTSACDEHTCECRSEGYYFWVFKRGALGTGMIELIDHPDVSQGRNVCALSMMPPLPPIASRDEALSLLSFAEWLNGISLVAKDFGDGGSVAFQIKMPMVSLTPEVLTEVWGRLCEAYTQLTQ